MTERKPGDRIELQGPDNTRDLGGYPTKDGRTIRMHRLIRAGALKEATESDMEILTGEYELKTIVDFRTASEISEKPDPVWPGVEYIHNPILNEELMGMTHEKNKRGFGMLKFLVELVRKDPDGPEKYMTNMYAQLVEEEFSRQQYRKFFEMLLKQEEGAILWHCTAGKDRAGTGAVLVLKALGVDDETIRRDYMLTNEYLKKNLDAMMKSLKWKVPDKKVREGIRIMNSACESFLDGLYATVDRLYGSMDVFLEKGLGLGEKELEILRNKYLE